MNKKTIIKELQKKHPSCKLFELSFPCNEFSHVWEIEGHQVRCRIFGDDRLGYQIMDKIDD